MSHARIEPRSVEAGEDFSEAKIGKYRPFVAGDAFTVADITGLVAVDFMKPAKLAVPDELKHLKRWHGDVAARPSASA